MPSTDFSQTSSGEHEIYLMKLLKDLGNLETTSFTAFLHYILRLVDAVPKRGSPPSTDDIRRDLEMCLRSVIAGMQNKHNESLMRTIDESLNCYCRGDSELVQRESLTKAINTSLLLLQPLSIGNCGAAANPNSDDFPLFLIHDLSINENERVPDIVCVPRKHAFQEVPRLAEGLGSPPLKNNQILKWKHFHSSWEILRGSKPLNTTRPDYGQYYSNIPLREYGYAASSEEVCQVDGYPLNAKRCAEDAAKVFYDTLGRNHIMNVAITDNLICVWYFDHESPIQTATFNFLEDLPYFLLFLFALQRFSSVEWGYIDQLSPINAATIGSLDISNEFYQDDDLHSEATFRGLDDDFAGGDCLSLCGRATRVIFGTVISGKNDTPAVLKMSWREKARLREGAFLRQAVKRLHHIDCLDACEYLPTPLGEKDFPGLSTDVIRRQLMIPVKDDATRIPYFIILPRYEPITIRTTDWEAFFADYLSLIYCHLLLWCVGIEQGDISVSNLMWDPVSQKPKLCDFDLSHFSEEKQTIYKNTGTMRFMASDLLTERAKEGKVKRQYRHDLESFVAVLVWMMFRYNNGKIHNEDALQDWRTPLPPVCVCAREATYRQLISEPTTTKTHLEHIPSHLQSALIAIVYYSCVVTSSCERIHTSQSTGKDSVGPWTRNTKLIGDREKDLEELQRLNSTDVVIEILGFLSEESASPAILSTIQKMKDRISDLSKVKAGTDLTTQTSNNS